MLPSVKVPTAANCCVVPALHVGVVGETDKLASVPVPTVRVVVPLTPDAEAVIVTNPPFFPCAMPLERTEAIFGFDDFQFTPTRFPPVLPSLKVPVAVNLIEVRTSILGSAGLMLMPTTCAVETVSGVEPLMVPNAAEMVVVPGATLPASPVPSIVAAAAFDELHSTDPEMSCVLLSLKVPVAENCLVVPVAMLAFAGVTASDTRLAPVTVSEVLPLTDPLAAEIVVVPTLSPVATPLASTFATLPDEDDQLSEVSSCVLPSSKFPTTLNCSSVPIEIDGSAGLSEMDTRCAATTVNVLVSLSAPKVAVIVVEPAASVVAKPVPSMLATDGEEELQVTPLLRSALDPSV